MKSTFESQMNLGRVQIAATTICSYAESQVGCPKRGAMKPEKSEKWFFAFFQSEPAAAQSVPTKIAFGHFSDFSKNFRGYTGGGEKAEL